MPAKHSKSTERASIPSILFATTALLVGPSAHAQHPRLLPQPVHLQYGTGSIPFTRLCVETLPASAPAEDKFARQTLIDGGLKPCHGSGGTAVHLIRTGALELLAEPGEAPGEHSREAYTLSIQPARVEIRSRSSAGVFYGVETLLQMVERNTAGAAILPFAEVQDWPALAYRATLMDAGSEGPMLTVAEVKAQLDFLAKWKGNQYFFYSEGNIEMRGYPLLNPRARFSQQEIEDIVAYARERHIDVVPAIEMYGHLHDLFRIEKYSRLADFPHGVEFDPNNPEVASLVQDWAAQVAELFPSKFVDIGFDETWALARAAEHAGPGSQPFELFIKQLNLVSGQFQSHGKTVLAYADIMVKFPGIVSRLPKGLIALPWWYEPDPDPAYKFWIDPLVAQHVPFVATSGVHSWNEIAPDFSMSFRNIDTWIAAGKRTGSLGLLNTLWTDNGQMLMQMSWPGIAYGAAAAWQSTPMHPETYFADYARIQYPPAIAEDMAAALASLDKAEVALQRAIGQRTVQEFWTDPFDPQRLSSIADKREELRTARLRAEDALEHLYKVRSINSSTPHLDSFIYGAQNIDLAGMKFIYALEIADTWKALPQKPTREQLTSAIGQSISNEAHSRAMDMMDGVTETQRLYSTAWQQQYTPYRMGTALGRWAAEYEFWRRVQTNLESLRTNFKTGDTLPPIQQVVHAQPR